MGFQVGKERRKLLILLSKIWKPEILNKDFIFSRTLKEKKKWFSFDLQLLYNIIWTKTLSQNADSNYGSLITLLITTMLY